MKLAITQIVVGTFISVSSALLVFWYLPTYLFPTETTEQIGDTTRHVFVTLSHDVFTLYLWLCALIVLGLVVLGCGIAQYFNSTGQDRPEAS